MLAMSGATRRAAAIADLGLIQSSMPAFAACGLMSACDNNPGISMVIRRKTGLLKRLRLSPTASSALAGAILANAAVISIVQVVLWLLIGRYGDGVVWATSGPRLGPVHFGDRRRCATATALGAAISTLVRTQDSASPITGIIFFGWLLVSGVVPAHGWLRARHAGERRPDPPSDPHHRRTLRRARGAPPMPGAISCSSPAGVPPARSWQFAVSHESPTGSDQASASHTAAKPTGPARNSTGSAPSSDTTLEGVPSRAPPSKTARR